MRVPRDSTATVLHRGRGRELEVLLVRRSPELAFFGGWWAFPGGGIDPVDRAGEETAREPAAARAALRELFEETGVLPPALAERLSPAERAPLRAALAGPPGPARDEALAHWARLVAAAPQTLRSLRRLCRITTPPFGPLRHRTIFHAIELPPGEEPSIEQGELVAGRFLRPRDALEDWRGGSLALVPPVRFLLEHFVAGDLDQFAREAQRLAEEIEQGLPHESCWTPGILSLPLATPTVPPATTTVCHLVGEELVYIVDPATPHEEERARLFRMLERMRDQGRRLGGVLVTHHHPDHVGSVAALAARYDLEVLAHPLTLERLPEPPARQRALGDGERLALGRAPDGSPDWELEVLATPGHDRGHLCFRDSRYGVLVAGDLVSTISTIVIDPPEGHLATYLASLGRVRERGVGMVLPAHGPAALDGDALLGRFLAHRAEREAKLVAALAAGHGSPGELLPLVYDDTPEALFPFAARSLAAGLEKLVEEGRARRLAPERYSLAGA